MKFSRGGFAGSIAILIAVATFVPAQGASAVTYKAASVVLSLQSADAWTKDAPRTPKIRLSWAKPAYTYGATIVGYAIQSSLDKMNWKTLVSNTKSSNVTAIVSSGLSLGVDQYFRVRAITKRDSKTLWGAYSSLSKRKPTGKPANPVLLGDSIISPSSTGTYTSVWLPQSASQKGGLSVSYKATASLNGATIATCVATSAQVETNCQMSGLDPSATYDISMKASNYRGFGINTNQSIPADSLFGLQWYLGEAHGVSATRAWTATKGSSAVVVAVLDSGITKHSDLEGQTVSGYDFVSDSTQAPSGDGDGWDPNPADPGNSAGESEWHGTHVAGIIAAKQDSTGTVGLAPKVKIQPVRVIGPGGGGVCDLAYAIRWAAGLAYEPLSGCQSFSGVPINQTPAKVINISLEASGACPSVLQNAITAAEGRGAILVAAAGNSSVANSSVSPTNCLGPISVGAVGYTGDKTSYTNFDVDISAPGGTYENPAGAPNLSEFNSFNGTILSTWNTGETAPLLGTYRGVSGTSMAAPVVSGIIALMVSARPVNETTGVTRAAIIAALLDSARPFAPGTTCAATMNCGTGIANAAEALRYLIYDIG